MASFVALYRGPSIASARLIGTTSDSETVDAVERVLIDQSAPQEADEGKSVYTTGGAVVGAIVRCADGTWIEKHGLDRKRHQLRKPPAWATDESHLEVLRELGGRGVRLWTVDGQVWEAPLDAFDRRGFRVSRGHGPQIGLRLCYWTTTDSREGRQLGFEFADRD